MERRRKCQETGVDQAKCNGEMQKHEEENLSMDLANKRSWTLAGVDQCSVVDRSQTTECDRNLQLWGWTLKGG